MAMFYLENKPHAKTRAGEHIATQNHYDYICREGKYEKLSAEREDMVYSASGNMPEWAETPKDYWTAAEKHRRVNGRGYREVKLALQEEFTLEENIQLVNKFCEKFNISTNHAYSFAIHDKPAAFDHSHRNIHVHIMFDERVIEPQRPLNEDQYFGRYSEDKYGNPVGGYYKDRYYTTKDCTVVMRKAWAELVNEKFQEKGMDIQISEKSLKDQYYELKAQGKDEEAEYYNRVPAPHMGKMYRNPKNVIRIDEYTRNLEREVSDMVSDDSDSVYDEEEDAMKTEEEMRRATVAEQKMIIFAADILMRRIAKEIQEEREAQRNSQKHIEQLKAETEENRDPIIITVADIREVMEERAQQYEREAAAYERACVGLHKKILSDKVLYHMAERDILQLDGRVLHESYIKADLREKDLLKKLKTVNINDPGYNALVEEERKASVDLRTADGLYKNYLYLRTQQSDRIEARLEVLKTDRNVLQEDAKELYKKQMQSERQHDMYYARALSLKNEFAEDQIVYADRLPDIIDRKSKVDGRKPVRRMETVFYKGSTYFLLNNKSEIFTSRTEPLKGVRYGDFITQGKAPIYDIDVKLEPAVSPKGKPYTQIKVVGVHESKEQARMYKVHNRLPVNREWSKSGGHTGGKDMGILTRGSSRGSTVEQVLNKMTNANMSTPAGRLIRLFEENDDMRGRPLNEYEKTVEEMKRWDNGMKLSGRYGR